MKITGQAVDPEEQVPQSSSLYRAAGAGDSGCAGGDVGSPGVLA